MATARDEVELLVKVLGAAGIEDLRRKYQALATEQGELAAAFARGEIEQADFEAATKANATAAANLAKALGPIEAALDRQAKAAERAQAVRIKAFDQAIAGLQREQAAEDRAAAAAQVRADREAARAARAAKSAADQSTFAGKYRQNLIALGYSFNDFFSVTGSLSQRLNAIANNLPMLLSGFGGLGLALSGLVPIIAMVIQNWDHFKAAFGVAVDEGVTQVDRLEKRIKELSKEHVTPVVDRTELDRSEAQLARLKKALSEFDALSKKQTPAEHAAGQQVESALTEAGAPEIAEALRQKFIREMTRQSEQAGPLAEARKAQAVAEQQLRDFTKALNRPLERGESTARAQGAERAQRDIEAAQEQARKARMAIEEEARKHVGEMTAAATEGHGAEQAAQRDQLAKELGEIGRPELAGQVRGATPAAVKAAEDFAAKVKAAIEAIVKSGAADELSQRRAGEAQAKGLDPEAALAYVKQGVATAFDEAFKARGIVAPAGADATKDGQRASKDLEQAITQIADRALARAEAAGKRDDDERRRALIAEIKADDLGGIADKLVASARAKGLDAGAVFVQVRDALADRVNAILAQRGLGGERGQEAAMGAAVPAVNAAIERANRAAAAAQKAADAAKKKGAAQIAQGQRRDQAELDKAGAAGFEQSTKGSGIAEQAAAMLAQAQSAGGMTDRFGRFQRLSRAQITAEVQRQVGLWLHRQVGIDQRGRPTFANTGMGGEETGLMATAITGMGQAQVDARMAGWGGAAPGRPGRGGRRPVVAPRNVAAGAPGPAVPRRASEVDPNIIDQYRRMAGNQPEGQFVPPLLQFAKMPAGRRAKMAGDAPEERRRAAGLGTNNMAGGVGGGMRSIAPGPAPSASPPPAQAPTPGPQASVLPAVQGLQQALGATQDAFNRRLAQVERQNAALMANARRTGGFNQQAQMRMDGMMPGNLPPGRGTA